jgi:uncharacterized cofD-like protein
MPLAGLAATCHNGRDAFFYRGEEEHMAFSRAPRELLADKRVVTIGGGTGPFAVLSSLKQAHCDITAIVSMADSGGSSRRLMDEFGQLPFGDLRQSLVALSRNGVLWRDVFNFRFRSNQEREAQGIGGHSLGNLIISALQEINGGDLLAAIQDAQELLDHTTLCAELDDESIIQGETNIDLRGEQAGGPLPTIRRVFLDHATLPCHQALRAIRRADVIIIGPGDLYTSIIPNLLVEGVARAIRESEAEKVYVCNLMTKRGETDGFTATDFVSVIHQYLGGRVDRVILHDGSFPDSLLAAYAEQEQHPVLPDRDAVQSLVPEVVVERMTAPNVDYVRHDPERLVRAVLAPYLISSSVVARFGSSSPNAPF